MPGGYLLHFGHRFPAGIGKLGDVLISMVDAGRGNAVAMLRFVLLDILAPAEGQVKEPGERVFKILVGFYVWRWHFCQDYCYSQPAFRLMTSLPFN